MNKNLTILLITVITMAGCLPRIASNSPAVTQQVNSVPTAEPGNTVRPAPPATMAVVSPHLESNCIPVSSTIPANMKIKGTAVFLDPRAPIIVSMGENEFRIPIGPSDQSVSPNNKLLVYSQINKDGLVDNVVTSNGTVISKFVKVFAGSLPGGDWISGESIRYLARSDTDSNQIRMLALNIRTGEVRELHTDFPDMADGNQQNWGIDNGAVYYRSEKGTDVIYDPSLSRIVYPKQGSYVSLYDVQKDVELATIKLADDGYDPIWSPNGQYFSLKGNDPTTLAPDIYVVSREGGQFTPITYLTKLYPKVKFGSYSWSPDSQQIAFWVKTDEYEFDDSLFLLDLVNMKMTNVCIRGLGSWSSIMSAGLASMGVGLPSKLGETFVLAGKPVWSPDGKKILITQFDSNRQKPIDILIDLETKIAYPIASNLEPMGWMSNDP